MIQYIRGNLFTSNVKVLVNTINTVGVIRKGIASDFKKYYPKMFEEYKQLCDTNRLNIGDLHLYKTSNKWILNFPTKEHWRSPSKLEFIEKGLQQLVANAHKLQINDIIALITILNPLAAASIMISLIGNTATPSVIYPIAFKTTLTIVIAGLMTLYSGEYIFKFFGINVMSIKVIGGILLMIIAINMDSGSSSKTRHTEKEHEEAQESEDISIVPLGIPILFGPGVIATIIVLNNNAMKSFSMFYSYILVSIAIIISSITTYFILSNVTYIKSILGVIGMKVLSRIMGLIVGAIAAQFLVSGIKGLWG